jgi:flagellar hook-associated protein 2
MQVESAPVTKLDWTKQLWTARQGRWNDLNSRLSNLATQASGLLSPSTWTMFSGVTSSNAAQVSATSLTNTPTGGTYSLDVTQLAATGAWKASNALPGSTAGTLQSGIWYRNTPAGSAAVGSTLLTNLRTQANATTGLNVGSTITMSFQEGGTTRQATYNVTGTSTMANLVTWAQSQLTGGATASLDAAGRIQVTSGTGTANEVQNLTFSAKNSAGTVLAAFNGSTGAQSSMVTAATDGGATAADTLAIVQNGSTKYVNIAAGDNEAAIVNKINATTGIGVTATLVSGKLLLTSNTSGAAQDFTVSSIGSLATTLGLAHTTVGADATFTVNGTAYTRSTNTNISDVINGVSLNLLATTGGTPVSISVGTPEASADSIKQKIKDFVTQYNSVIDFINTTTGEAKVAQPKTLNEYLQGPLANDFSMKNVSFDLGKIAGNFISGLPAGMSTLADIGISTGAIGSGTNALSGKLVIDEAKLDSALATNRQGVRDLLDNSANGPGIIRQLSTKVSQLRIGGSVDAAVQGASSQVTALQKRIDSMNDHLATKRAYYEKMFASLETTVGRMQSQFSGLAARMSQLTTG